MKCNANAHSNIFSRTVCLLGRLKKESKKIVALLLPAQYWKTDPSSLFLVAYAYAMLAVTKVSLISIRYIGPLILSLVYSFISSNCVKYVVNIEKKKEEGRMIDHRLRQQQVEQWSLWNEVIVEQYSDKQSKAALWGIEKALIALWYEMRWDA